MTDLLILLHFWRHHQWDGAPAHVNTISSSKPVSWTGGPYTGWAACPSRYFSYATADLKCQGASRRAAAAFSPTECARGVDCVAAGTVCSATSLLHFRVRGAFEARRRQESEVWKCASLLSIRRKWTPVKLFASLATGSGCRCDGRFLSAYPREIACRS